MTSLQQRCSPEPETSIPLQPLTPCSQSVSVTESMDGKDAQNSMAPGEDDGKLTSPNQISPTGLQNESNGHSSARSYEGGFETLRHENDSRIRHLLQRKFYGRIPKPELMINEGLEDRWNDVKGKLMPQSLESIEDENPTKSADNLSNGIDENLPKSSDKELNPKNKQIEPGSSVEDFTMVELGVSDLLPHDEGIEAINESDKFIKRIVAEMLFPVNYAKSKMSEFEIARKATDAKALRELADEVRVYTEDDPIAKAWSDKIESLKSKMESEEISQQSREVYSILLDFFKQEQAVVLERGMIFNVFKLNFREECHYIVQRIRVDKWTSIFKMWAFIFLGISSMIYCLGPSEPAAKWTTIWPLVLVIIGLVLTVLAILARLIAFWIV